MNVASLRVTLVSISLLLVYSNSRGILSGVNNILVYSEILRSPS